MIIREKGALPSIALLCILALVTSCRKEEGTSPGVVMENHEPTQREIFKAEIERLVACSNMPMHEMMGAPADSVAEFAKQLMCGRQNCC